MPRLTDIREKQDGDKRFRQLVLMGENMLANGIKGKVLMNEVSYVSPGEEIADAPETIESLVDGTSICPMQNRSCGKMSLILSPTSSVSSTIFLTPSQVSLHLRCQ